MNVGERVGDYEIVQVLGAGGMGQVYKVRNVFSDRVEAMKVLLPNLGGDTELVERFQREIKLQAALDHPNIARLHTAQLVGSQLIMVMEYVEGSSVELLLHSGPLPLRDALSCILQVLDALAYAHAHGVTHRDIKPANIMWTPQGVAKLMDFGIARVEADRRLTKTGTAVGSLFYMSPEQIKGMPPDARSDIYSLGITMYEMVTGQRPFSGDSDYSIMAAHLEQQPRPPMEVIPGVPGELSEIILMAIAKDPAQRFQTAAAFHAALNSVAAGAAPGGTVLRSGPAPAAARTVAPTVVNAPVQFPMGAPPPPLPPAPLPPTMPQAVPPPQFPPPQPYQQAPQQQAPPPMYMPPAASPAVTKSGRRGLYMALGSVATLLVLAGAVIEGPKLWHSGANVTGPGSGNSAATPAQGTTDPAAAPQQPPPGASPSDTGPTGTPAAQTPATQPPPVAVQPVQVQPVQAPPVQIPVQATPLKQAKQPPPKSVATPVAQQQPPPVPVQTQPPPPVVQQPPVAQQQPPVQVQPPPQQAPPTQPPAVSAQQMNALRQDYNLLAVRVSSSKSGLQSIQRQMQRQGLDLRGDILEAESRMDYQMKEAQDSIRAGDPAAAKSEMQMAERALETIEKFLGR